MKIDVHIAHNKQSFMTENYKIKSSNLLEGELYKAKRLKKFDLRLIDEFLRDQSQIPSHK